MHETLPCYLVLEVGAKLAKCFRGHLRAPHAISCISCVLLYDWPSHLREQINRTFQFRNCHGKFFCSFWCIHGNNPRAVSVWEKRLHTKKSFPVGKRYLPTGKRASITTTIERSFGRWQCGRVVCSKVENFSYSLSRRRIFQRALMSNTPEHNSSCT